MTILAYIVAYWIMFSLGLTALMTVVFFVFAIKDLIKEIKK